MKSLQERFGFRIWCCLRGPAVLAGLTLLAGCGHKATTNQTTLPELPALSVRVQTAQSKPRAATEEVVGTVRAKLRATLEAKLSGRIGEMPVVLGQHLRPGQLVARLDAAEVKARLEQAQAALGQAERDWKRISTLLGQQAVTQSEYDAAEARQRAAKAAVAEAQAMLGYVEVLAPFEGVVTKKWADLGDLAVPGKPLVDLEASSALQLEADVPEAIASRVQYGARLLVRSYGLTNELTGTVSEIAPAADPLSRTFRVKLDLPPAAGLRSGQFARLVVPLGESRSVRVPASAVVRRGQLEILFVVADQHAQLRLVKTGQQVGDELEILSGLEAGDQIVVDGPARLRDGQPVIVK